MLFCNDCADTLSVAPKDSDRQVGTISPMTLGIER